MHARFEMRPRIGLIRTSMALEVWSFQILSLWRLWKGLKMAKNVGRPSALFMAQWLFWSRIVFDLITRLKLFT